MHHPTDRIVHNTTFVTSVVEHWMEREIAQWVHTMKDRSDDPSHHERTLLPRSSLGGVSENNVSHITGFSGTTCHITGFSGTMCHTLQDSVEQRVTLQDSVEQCVTHYRIQWNNVSHITGFSGTMCHTLQDSVEQCVTHYRIQWNKLSHITGFSGTMCHTLQDSVEQCLVNSAAVNQSPRYRYLP